MIMTKQLVQRAAALCAMFALTIGTLQAQDTTFQTQEDTTFQTQDTMFTEEQDTAMSLQASQSIMEVIRQQEDLSTFAQALQQTGLADAFQEDGPYTIFAPTNEAFEQLPDDLQQLIAGVQQQGQGLQRQGQQQDPFEEMEDDTTFQQQGQQGAQQQGQQGAQQQDQQLLIALLRRHIVSDNVTSAAARDINRAVTILGDTLNVSAQGGEIQIEDATVEQADLEAENGVVHVIGTVLVPQGGISELEQLNQQMNQQQGQQQQGQQVEDQDPIEEPIEEMEEDTTTFQQQGQQGAQQQGQQQDPIEEMETETDTLGVDNR